MDHGKGSPGLAQGGGSGGVSEGYGPSGETEAQAKEEVHRRRSQRTLEDLHQKVGTSRRSAILGRGPPAGMRTRPKNHRRFKKIIPRLPLTVSISRRDILGMYPSRQGAKM